MLSSHKMGVWNVMFIAIPPASLLIIFPLYKNMKEKKSSISVIKTRSQLISIIGKNFWKM